MNKFATFRIDSYFYGVSGVNTNNDIIVPFNPAVESHKVAKDCNLVGMTYQYSITGIEDIDRLTYRVFSTQKQWQVIAKSLAENWGVRFGTKKFAEKIEDAVGRQFFIEYKDVLIAMNHIFAPQIVRIFPNKEEWQLAYIEADN